MAAFSIPLAIFVFMSFKKGRKRTAEPKVAFDWNKSLPIEENLKKLKMAEPKKVDQFAGQVLKEKPCYNYVVLLYLTLKLMGN